MRSPAGREDVVETAGTRRVQAGSLDWLAETGVDTSAAGLLAAAAAMAASSVTPGHPAADLTACGRACLLPGPGALCRGCRTELAAQRSDLSLRSRTGRGH